MKWLSKLLKKPAPQPTAQPSARPGSPQAQQAGAVSSGNAPFRPPEPQDPPQVWVKAICQAPNTEQAQTWLAGLQGDDWLGEVALGARFAEIRFAAAQRIEATEVLERIAQKCRDKDKRVHRHCADLLKQRRQRDANVRRATEIADTVGALLEHTPLPANRLLDLKQAFEALGECGEAGQTCQNRLDQALERLRLEAEALRDLHARQMAAAELAQQCAATAWPEADQEQDWRARRDALAQAAGPAWLADHAHARTLAASLAVIDGRLDALTRDAEALAACEAFLAPLEAAPPASAEAVAAWQALAKPLHPTRRQALETRWTAVQPVPEKAPEPVPLQVPVPHQEVAAPTKPARTPPAYDPEALRGLLDQLEQAIAEGHLADADAAAETIKRSLGGQPLHGKLDARWHGLQARLAELRGWARWGTGQARDGLIADAQALVGDARPVQELAVAITALREAWKGLNAHSPSTKAQWESFDAALEQAYQPVAAWRAEQTARQEAAKAAKETLCAGWEAEWAGFDWTQADFKTVEAKRGELLRQWHAAPAAAFRDERPLRKRFDALIAGLDQHLDAARQAESARREQLIASAEALVGQSDLRQAMSAAKALQKHWSQDGSGVHLARADEQRLWGRFRAACNAIFERQDALRTEQAARQAAQAQAREQLLADLAAQIETADAEALKRALAEFRQAWAATQTPDRDTPTPPARGRGRREAQDPLEARSQQALKQAQDRLDALRQDRARARFDLLARKAALAERLERVAAESGALEVALAETRQAWEQLPALPGKLENLLAKRLASASEATRERLTQGRQQRESLLLDLEIALDLPSPAAFAEARRARQLDRLQQRFGTGTGAEAGVDAESLLTDWYATPALADPDQAPRLAAVVDRLAAQRS